MIVINGNLVQVRKDDIRGFYFTIHGKLWGSENYSYEPVKWFRTAEEVASFSFKNPNLLGF